MESLSENLLLSNGNYVGSDYRELLLKRAKDAYDEGDIANSIFYQIKSLCTGFESHYSDSDTAKEDFQKADKSLYQDRLIQESPLLQYAMKFLKSKTRNKPVAVDDIFSLDNAKNSDEGMRSVHEACSSMPEEWTIIQLCKEQLGNTTYSVFREIFAADAPIYLTILKHPRSKEFPDPICIRLTGENQVQLFEKFSVLTNSFIEFSTFPNGPGNNQDLESYWKGMGILEDRVASAVSELKIFMGPWVALLCGNVKKKCKELQRTLFETVDKFCSHNDLNCQQRVLLSLLAQQRHLLNDDHIKQASSTVALEGTNCDVDDYDNVQIIYEFLTHLPAKEEMTFGPCILILDERIDHLYWEVLNPWQELCRMSSFHILVRLFERYKSRIKHGYLMVDVKKGRSVVNPDCNLPNMEERMKSFFNYWLPHWKCTYNMVPKMEDFMKIFDEADCYVYCGHGSGLQYINGRKISKFQMNCVVFLFGCDSVRLRSQGLHSEMTGSHLFYHAALCPAVVGTLQLGFDFQVDKIATTLLSEWIPSSSEDVVHWHYVDKPSWKKGTIKSSVSKDARLLLDQYEGSLARAVCAIHQKTEEKLYNTVGFVYRGLPAWNSGNSNLPEA